MLLYIYLVGKTKFPHEYVTFFNENLLKNVALPLCLQRMETTSGYKNELTTVNEPPLITPNKNQFISPLVYQLLSSIRSFTALAGLMSWAQLVFFQNETTRRKWHMLDLTPRISVINQGL